MKKIYAVILLLILFSLLFCSCNNMPGESTESTPKQDKSVYETLNDLVKIFPRTFTVSIQSIKSSETLHSNYNISEIGSGQKIIYSCEEFSTFEIGEGSIIIPDDYIVMKTGSLIVSDGKIVEQNGESVSIDFDKVSVPEFSFAERNFKNVKNENGTFSADVVDISAFCGWESGVMNMKITVSYTTLLINEINIFYHSQNDGADIIVTYRFE